MIPGINVHNFMSSAKEIKLKCLEKYNIHIKKTNYTKIEN